MIKQKYVECSICSAEIALDPAEGLGSLIYCAYCQTELKLIRDLKSEDPEAVKATEDVD